MNTDSYQPPWWLPSGHLQTLYAYFSRVGVGFAYRRERWQTPDGDFIDLDWCDGATSDANLVVLFHGLEGSSRSQYAVNLMKAVQAIGWAGVVCNFRSCSGEMNRLARSYHSGDSAEGDWILRRLKSANPSRRIYAAGVSLGGNMLLKWLGEQEETAAAIVDAAVVVSAPLDLRAAVEALDHGLNKWVYTANFLRTMKQKSLAKIAAHGLPIDVAAVRACVTLRGIDELCTAPIHGFANAEDYYQRSSSKPFLAQVRVPTLLINARNDPFVPSVILPNPSEVSANVMLEFPENGGHVGFVSGNFPGRLDWLPQRIIKFLVSQC